jgi:hypothetical protein
MTVLIISFSIGVWLGLAVRIQEEIHPSKRFFHFFKNIFERLSTTVCRNLPPTLVERGFRLPHPNEQFWRHEDDFYVCSPALARPRFLPFGVRQDSY